MIESARINHDPGASGEPAGMQRGMLAIQRVWVCHTLLVNGGTAHLVLDAGVRSVCRAEGERDM